METLLALEMVRVTEAAAIASARYMGRGAKDDADRANLRLAPRASKLGQTTVGQD